MPIDNYYYYPFRLESKYRYSGLLYDKLKHITSHIYVDIYFNAQFSAADQLIYSSLRFDARNMLFNYMYNRNPGVHTPNYYLEESVARNLHFINN